MTLTIILKGSDLFLLTGCLKIANPEVFFNKNKRGEWWFSYPDGQYVFMKEGVLYTIEGWSYKEAGYCEACRRSGMYNCAHFDKCGSETVAHLTVEKPEHNDLTKKMIGHIKEMTNQMKDIDPEIGKLLNSPEFFKEVICESVKEESQEELMSELLTFLFESINKVRSREDTTKQAVKQFHLTRKIKRLKGESLDVNQEKGIGLKLEPLEVHKEQLQKAFEAGVSWVTDMEFGKSGIDFELWFSCRTKD